jgi:hypothetical protein
MVRGLQVARVARGNLSDGTTQTARDLPCGQPARGSTKIEGRRHERAKLAPHRPPRPPIEGNFDSGLRLLSWVSARASRRSFKLRPLNPGAARGHLVSRRLLVEYNNNANSG